MTIVLILIGFGLVLIGWAVVAFVGWALVRGGTRKPTPRPQRPQDYRMRYRGGDAPCRACGQPTMYSDSCGPVCPNDTCRRAS